MATTLAGVEIEQVPAELERMLRQIDDCREYESSWDPDDPRVSEDTIETAKALVTKVFEKCARQGIDWQSPTVSVAPDARIHLAWGERGRWASWRVGPAEATIVLVIYRDGAEPTRQEVSGEDAVQAILDFQCDCGGGGA